LIILGVVLLIIGFIAKSPSSGRSASSCWWSARSTRWTHPLDTAARPASGLPGAEPGLVDQDL